MASGNRSTNFVVACNLLSQYVKENGFPSRSLESTKGLATMNLLQSIDEVEKETETERKGNTLELFPQSRDQEKIKTSEMRKQENSQLTIFYDGKVLVFDEVSAEKADDLMQFASKTSSTTPKFTYLYPAMTSKGQPHFLAQPRFPDLPLTRKHSLQRFFDMRKSRINSRAPYTLFGSPKKIVTPAKSEESTTWLGLVPQKSFSLSSDFSK